MQEEYGPTKELVRTCEEDVELAKCEGSCVSSTQPSAMERWDTESLFYDLWVVKPFKGRIWPKSRRLPPGLGS